MIVSKSNVVAVNWCFGESEVGRSLWKVWGIEKWSLGSIILDV